MKNLNFFIFFFFLTLHLAAQTPRQVLDLSPGPVSTFNDAQDELRIGVGNRVFMVYRQFKYELWASDGSTVGICMCLVLKEKGAVLARQIRADIGEI